MANLSIERRIALSVTVGRYLRSTQRFNDASKDFADTCQALRAELGTEQRFVVQIDFKHYLVTSDHEGNFEVEQLDTL